MSPSRLVWPACQASADRSSPKYPTSTFYFVAKHLWPQWPLGNRVKKALFSCSSPPSPYSRSCSVLRGSRYPRTCCLNPPCARFPSPALPLPAAMLLPALSFHSLSLYLFVYLCLHFYLSLYVYMYFSLHLCLFCIPPSLSLLSFTFSPFLSHSLIFLSPSLSFRSPHPFFSSPIRLTLNCTDAFHAISHMSRMSQIAL